MKIIRNLGIIWIFPWLLSSCASHGRQAETNMIQIASYRESDEAIAGAAFRSLHEHGILAAGTGGGGWIEICVYPSQAKKARTILRSALAHMSPQQRVHAFQVFDQ